MWSVSKQEFDAMRAPASVQCVERYEHLDMYTAWPCPRHWVTSFIDDPEGCVRYLNQVPMSLCKDPPCSRRHCLCLEWKQPGMIVLF